MPDVFYARADGRDERFKAIVTDLLPRLRQITPELSESALVEAAERMAEYRLADEELARVDR